MGVPAAKRDSITLQRQANQLQRSTKTIKQRPPRAEPILVRAGHRRAGGSGWDPSVVGNEEKALCHVACVNRTVPTRFAWKSIQCNYAEVSNVNPEKEGCTRTATRPNQLLGIMPHIQPSLHHPRKGNLNASCKLNRYLLPGTAIYISE